MSGLSDTSAFDAFDRMEGKINQMEAEAEANAELAEDFAGNDLENEFDDLEADPAPTPNSTPSRPRWAWARRAVLRVRGGEAEQKQTVSSGGRGTWDSDDI